MCKGLAIIVWEENNSFKVAMNKEEGSHDSLLINLPDKIRYDEQPHIKFELLYPDVLRDDICQDVAKSYYPAHWIIYEAGRWRASFAVYEAVWAYILHHPADVVFTKKMYQMADLSGTNLNGADLSWANLNGANLSEANLNRADLSWANLSWANLSGANLNGANLNRATLSWANLNGANLSEVDLSWANLNGATLSRANLSGANLNGADLNGANLTDAVLTPRQLIYIMMH